MTEYSPLSAHDQIQAMKHVFVPNTSTLTSEATEFGFDSRTQFMTLKEGEECRHVGFIALDGQQFDRVPASIAIEPDATPSYDRDTDAATLPSAQLFNCQEAYFSLPDPRGMQLGLYATDQLIQRSEFPPAVRFLLRFLTATRQAPDLVGQARLQAARQGTRLSREALDGLLRQEMDAHPVRPTFAARRALLASGRLERLGIVAPITHLTGKHRPAIG